MPALDLLIETNGSSLFRVVPRFHGLDQQRVTDPSAGCARSHNPATVYEAPAMQDIWNTIDYLNQKGISGNQILLNFMGWTPTWLSGSGRYGAASYINAGKESEVATMIASLVYYGRKVKNLDFTLLSPLNESDLNGGIEGPSAGRQQVRDDTRGPDCGDDYMGVSSVRSLIPPP